MTAPKEALELKPCPFCGGEAVITQRGNSLYSTVYECTDCGCRLSTSETFNYGSRWNTRAASLQGEGAVERVARIIDPNAGWGVKLDSDYVDLRHEQARLEGKQRIAITKADAILATGLVPDEAAIRADEREKCAKIAESDALHDQWPLHGSEMQAPSKRMQIAIAAAIRSNQAKP